MEIVYIVVLNLWSALIFIYACLLRAENRKLKEGNEKLRKLVEELLDDYGDCYGCNKLISVEINDLLGGEHDFIS